MSILEDRLAELERLVLDSGGHDSWEKGACVMEAVAYIAGEPFTDHPECASPVITSFLISWNDALPTGERQMLKPYIPQVVGTNTGAADDEVRAWMCTDWLARECAPAFLRLAGLTEQAVLLEQLAPLVDAKSAKAAQPALDDARVKGAAARAAARDAAGAAARAAARDAAGDAAGDAAKTKLAPTVAALQESAFGLLDAMLAVRVAS